MIFSGKTTRWGLGLLTACALSGATHAADTPVWLPLAQENGCTSCHAIQDKIVGPAFQSVAQKYATDPDATGTLMRSIQNGSRGKWGRAAMMPHPNLSQDELKQLATWVLGLKP